ncbi:MAG: 3-deoxy-D-manno-octulosonic acid transferase [Pseudomonadota bacterium]
MAQTLSLGERLALLLYQALTLVLLPAQPIYLLLRARRSPGYRLHWSERFWGHAPLATGGPRLWVHAVSVGETQAVTPLIREFLLQHPSHQVLLTHTTITGRETGAKAFAAELGTRVLQCYLPYDLPWAVQRFLVRAAPSLGLLMETEIWPQLMRACVRRGLPVALINGRLSERSAHKMHQLAWLARPALRSLRLVVVQAQEHAERFQALVPGLPVTVSGSMKFDLPVREDRVALGQQWRAGLAAQRVVLLASSREEEESGFLRAWAHQTPSHALLVIVPRHPERFDAVAQDIARAGLQCLRRSHWGDASPAVINSSTTVVLGDSLGEMQAYVSLSDCVVVGGSLIPLGGQNPIEACAQGRPVVMGPHMFNFPEIARQLVEHGAAQTAQTPEEAIAQCSRWLTDETAYSQAAASALQLAKAHQGATARTLAVLEANGLLR